MKVSVDLAKCKAHGRCYNFAPDVFERGPKGQAVVLKPEISDDDAELIGAANTGFMMCPEGAIALEDE
jgi:ferredoxin